MLPEPALMFWILGAPMLVAVVDLLRTVTAWKRAPPSEPGQWSRTLGIHRR